MIKQKITLFLLLIAFGISAFAQQEARRDRAESFSGTWGVRILHPTAYDKSKTPTAKVNAENFDIPTFMAQIDQLTTLNHVMINISRGHQSSWYSSPYPEMEAIMGSDLFPERDLFGELLDSLKSRGLKVLVYFSITGMDKGYLTADQMNTWNAYLATAGLSHKEGVAKILEYYSLKFGEKIDGWWVDRVNSSYTDEDHLLFATALRAGNPNAMLAMHRKVGSPVHQSNKYCEYAAGHPWTMLEQVPWDDGTGHENIDLIKSIEAGPWVNMNGTPDDSEGTALGAIFIPIQAKWRDGNAGFPSEQAIDWTSRVINVGGMYTWAVARVDNGFALPQFNQLLEINEAIKNGFEPGEQYNVTFRIKDQINNSPLQNISVIADKLEQKTEANGEALFSLAAGNHNVRISHPNYEEIRSSLGVYKDTILDFSLTERARAVKFQLYSENTGNPLPNISVLAGDEELFTGLNGMAIFNLYNGQYEYSLSHPDYFTKSSVLELTKDTTIQVLMITNKASVKFRVYSDEKPISNAAIRINEGSLTTNQTGIARFEDLIRFEQFDWSVSKEGYENLEGTLSLKNDTTVNLNLKLQTSTQGQKFPGVFMFPNPAQSKLNFESGDIITRLEIYDLRGALLVSKEINNNKAEIDILSWEDGLYIARVYRAGVRTINLKLIKN